MKIKDGGEIGVDDFMYDLFDGGYIRPDELLEDSEDIKKVLDAMKTIKEFEEALEKSGRLTEM